VLGKDRLLGRNTSGQDKS